MCISAWVSSLALSLSLFAAPLMGHLAEKFGCRMVIIAGMLSSVVGLVATSFVAKIEVMFLTYSTLVGLGACCGRTSCFLIVAKYFNKKRSFATGAVTMGPSLGMFFWGPVTQVLLDSVGWRNTFRIMALVCSVVVILSITFSPKVEEQDKTLGKVTDNTENTECNTEDDKAKLQTTKDKVKMIDLSVFRIPQYCILVASFTLIFMCRFIPNIHLVSHTPESLIDLSVFRIPQYCILVASFTLIFMCRFIPNIHLVSHTPESLIDLSVFKIPQYCILVASFTLIFMCRFIPNIHLVSHDTIMQVCYLADNFLSVWVGDARHTQGI